MWYNRVVADLAAIPDFINYYDNELQEAKKECAIRGIVEKALTGLPGITEHRFNQLQEIEAVLEHLNIQLRKIRRKHFQKYLFFLLSKREIANCQSSHAHREISAKAAHQRD